MGDPGSSAGAINRKIKERIYLIFILFVLEYLGWRRESFFFVFLISSRFCLLPLCFASYFCVFRLLVSLCFFPSFPVYLIPSSLRLPSILPPSLLSFLSSSLISLSLCLPLSSSPTHAIWTRSVCRGGHSSARSPQHTGGCP